MAWRVEKDEASNRQIVLDGFEQGIAASPYAGIANLRNIDITSVPGQASVSYENSAIGIPPTISAQACTFTDSSDFVTTTTTGMYDGIAIVFDSITTTTGISTGRVYWADVGALGFRVYEDINLSTLATLTTDGTGTFSTYTLGEPIDHAVWNNVAGSPSLTKTTGNTVIMYLSQNTTHSLNGKADELRIRDSEVDENWHDAEYVNQATPGTFFTVGTEQTGGGGGTTYNALAFCSF